MNRLEQMVEEWLSSCGCPPMASSSKEAEILQATVAGIPRVAQAIAAIPTEHRAKALDTVERSYLQTIKDLGFAESAALRWVSAVMRRLRGQVAEQGLARQKLKILHEELVRSVS